MPNAIRQKQQTVAPPPVPEIKTKKEEKFDVETYLNSIYDAAIKDLKAKKLIKPEAVK